MKVKELIKLLKQYEDYFEIKIYSENWGHSVDIKDITLGVDNEVSIGIDMKGL